MAVNNAKSNAVKKVAKKEKSKEDRAIKKVAQKSASKDKAAIKKVAQKDSNLEESAAEEISNTSQASQVIEDDPTSPYKTAICDRETLIRALKTMAAGVDLRAKEEVMRYVLVGLSDNYVNLAASNKRCYVETRVSSGKSFSDKTKEASKKKKNEEVKMLCVPHNSLQKAVEAQQEDDLLIKLDEDKLRLKIQGGRRSLILNGIEAKEFPAPPQGEENRLGTLEAKGVSKGLGLLSRVASDDTHKPGLYAVVIDLTQKDPKLVASDTHRLATMPLQTNLEKRPEEHLFLPLPVAKALSKDLYYEKVDHIDLSEYGEDSDSFGERGVKITYGETLWLVPHPEGTFPEWQKLMPKDYDCEEMEFSSEDLQSALKAIEAIRLQGRASNSGTPLRLHLKKEGSMIRYYAPEVGELIEELPDMRLMSKDIEMGFSPPYLIDMIRLLDSKEIKLLVQNAEQGVLFEASERQYLLMPVRLPPKKKELDKNLHELKDKLEKEEEKQAKKKEKEDEKRRQRAREEKWRKEQEEKK